MEKETQPGASQSERLLGFMAGFLSEERSEIIENVLKNRTRYISVVLEDIYQPHNASAVIRSCDCFGVQDLHVIENKFDFSVSKKVVHGSSKWVDLYQYNELENNTVSTLQKLKNEGYRIVATTPHTTQSISELDLTKGKVALVFGTEQHGISSDVRDNADELVKIPMYGFTESFNISVSAALCLQILSEKLRHTDLDWQLNNEDYLRIKLDWVKKSVRRPEMLEKEFLKTSQS